MKKLLVILLGIVVILSAVALVACDEEEPSGTPVGLVVYTVTVDGQEQKVIEGECAAEPSRVKDGCDFVQWLSDGEDFDFSTPITQNMTIESVWTAHEAPVEDDDESFQVVISASADSEAKSIWTAEYGLDGISFDIEVIDPYVYTDNSDMGYNDNVELVLQTIPSMKYDYRYTFNFLVSAKGEFWFRRASNTTTFGTSCAYDLFLEVGENLIFSSELTESGWKASVYFSYELLNSDYRSAYGNVRFCPAMRNTDIFNTTFVYYQANGCAWGRPSTFIMIDKNNSMIKSAYQPEDVNEAFENSSLYDGLRLTDNLATVECGSTVAEFKVGCTLFNDRYYGLNDNTVSEALLGKSYLYDSIEGSYGIVTDAGYVVLLVPEFNYASLEYDIENDGFVKIISEQINLANIAAGGSLEETIGVYVKWCEVGEVISYGKYYIAVFAATEDAYVCDYLTEPANVSTDFTGYEVLSRNWQGVTTIERTAQGRIFASWVSGGNNEPRRSNYNIVVYSDDEGVTWNDLWIINHDSASVKINDAQLWLDPDGVLWVFYTQSYFSESQDIVTGGAAFDNYAGVWAIKVEDPDAEVLTHTQPERLFDGLLRNNPVVLSDGTWLACPNYFVNDLYTVVYQSSDKGNTWSVRGMAYIPQATDFDETLLFVQNDGSLRMMVRNGGGTILEVYSYDNGYTWSDVHNTGILNPCSRFQMVRLPSGNVMLICNENSSARNDMTVSLSSDDGHTWSYKMTLDLRDATTYPDYAIDASTGKIYVIWDQNRLVNGNICMAIFTEEDIMQRSVYGQENIIVVSACPYENDGLTEGDNLGSIDEDRAATGGFDLTNDSGEAAYAVQLGEGVQNVWVKDFSGSSVYFEADVKVGSVLNRDGYPKVGLVLGGDDAEIYYFIDARNWLQNYYIGYVTGVDGTMNWGTETLVPASMNYIGDYVKLAILKDGAKFRFFVNGYCVLETSGISGLGADDAVVAGIRTHNLRVELKNYSVTADKDVISQMTADNKSADVLIMGDSYTSLYRWKTYFEEDLGVNVSVDGATIQYWINNFDKIVMKYSPETIVISLGSKEINSGKSAEEVYSQYMTLISLVNSKLPSTKVIVISVNPTAPAWECSDEVKAINSRLEEYCEGNSAATFVDFASTLFRTDGAYVDVSMYADRTYYSAKAYELWNQMIKAALSATEEDA